MFTKCYYMYVHRLKTHKHETSEKLTNRVAIRIIHDLAPSNGFIIMSTPSYWTFVDGWLFRASWGGG